MGEQIATDDAPTGDLSACRQCQMPIPAKASICRHCHSHQDWRGHLQLSSTVLALMVALVSVLSVAMPTIAAAFRSGDSRIELSNPVVRGEEVYVVASNLGSKPAVLERGLIHSDYLGMDSELELINPADAFVVPGSRQVGFRTRLRLSPMDAQLQALDATVDGMAANVRGQAGHIGIWERGAKGHARFIQLPVSFEDVVTLLQTHAERCQQAPEKPTIYNGCSGIRELRAETDKAHKVLVEALRGSGGTPSPPRTVR